MAHGAGSTKRARTVGYISYDARVRIDERVKRIVDRREAAIEQAQHAARRLSGGTTAEGDDAAVATRRTR